MTTPETTIETSALPDYAPVPRSAVGPALNEQDIPGYLEAPANALAYSWKHFIGGHVGRLGTRDDVKLHQQYMADISEKYTGVLAGANIFTDSITFWVMESIRLNLGYGSQVHP